MYLRDSQLEQILFCHSQEILELRSRGWKTDPQIESYYQSKISQLEKNTKRTLSSTSQGPKAALKGSSASIGKENTSSAEDVIVNSSSREKEDNRKEKSRERLVVKVEGERVEIEIFSVDSQLVKDAKTVLSHHFTQKSNSGTGQVKYSREAMIAMANNPAAD